MPKSKPTTPRKPRPDFPLFPHATGRWCKKVCGKLRYFGKVGTDPKGQAALDKWLEQKDDLLAGREPRAKSAGGATVRDLVNAFLTHKKDLVTAGELSQWTFQEYHNACARLVKAFGRVRPVDDLVADDFRRLRRRLPNSGDRSGCQTKSSASGLYSSSATRRGSSTSQFVSARISRSLRRRCCARTGQRLACECLSGRSC